MLSALFSGAMGTAGAVIYCKINKIPFGENKYNFPSGKLCLYVGTIVGLLLGILINKPLLGGF